MSALKELLDRVNAATGPMTTREVEECIRLSPWYADRPSHDPIWNDFCKALYGSVDAALALVERVLPGMGATMWIWPDVATAAIGTKEIDFAEYMAPVGEGKARTAALAILSALLSALIARDGQ